MFQECVYCKIKQPLETRFCDNCARPLDIADAIQMEKDQEKKMESMVYELMRKERAKQSQNEAELEKNSLIEEQKEKIKQLEQIIQKVT
jgi:predicted amidophosphoribosyltransferase